MLVLAQGPEIGRSRPPRGVDDYEPLRYAWYMVQDSTLGLVFSEPSGVRRKDTQEEVDGDFFLQALEPVRAFEIRVITFDVWRDRNGTLTTTELNPLWNEERALRDYDPRWSDVVGRNRHLGTSLVWIANVMLTDGTIRSYDASAVVAFAQAIDAELTAEDLLPPEDS